jgi:predicted ATPase
LLHTIAVSGYRSLREIGLPLGQLNLITGANGTGKSSVYRALRLLAASADGDLVQSLAREGGLHSTLWAGPESFSKEVLAGVHPVQGTIRKKPFSLKLGFTSEDFCYCVDLGLPTPGSSHSAFMHDPVIKRECVWHGVTMRPGTLCVDRRNENLRCRPGKKWIDVEVPISHHNSVLSEFSDPESAPELILMREMVRGWRFYDHFRTDVDAPSRKPCIGTFTPVLASDGSDLAAALHCVRFMGNSAKLQQAIERAFPGSELQIEIGADSYVDLCLKQNGMLRPLKATELSDGTLRFILLCAALLTPRPPELMVLNEPETSLHPELIPALAKLIAEASAVNQMIVVTHSQQLIGALSEIDQCEQFELEKVFGATQLANVDPFDLPSWKWPTR